MVHTILSIDHQLFWLINSSSSQVGDIFFTFITQFGNAWVVAPLLLVLFLFKVPTRQKKRVIIYAIIAITLSGLINRSIKEVVKRPRPLRYFALNEHLRESPEGKREIHTVYEHHTRRSFPSGHTNTAFAAASVVIIIFGGYFWSAYILAFLVGISRIYLGVHFPFDTVGGMIIGIIIPWLIYLYYFKASVAQRNGKNIKNLV